MAENLQHFLIKPVLLSGLSIIIFLLLAVFYLSHGNFSFSLDDPYIHLRLAENIAHGTYGINRGESAAPSSSILWPFLLVPLLTLGLGQYAALLLNMAAFTATLVLLVYLLAELEALPRRWLLAAVITGAIILSFNLAGLVLTGMEHSLQVTLSLAGVLGLHAFLKNGKANYWWLTCLVVAPLVRYENAAFLIAAAIVLAARSHLKTALSVTVLGLGAAALFSLFLVRHGLPFLPSSVLVKSNAANAVINLENEGGIALAVAFSFLAYPLALDFQRLRRPSLYSNSALLGFACCFTIAAHIMFGQSGWYARYEIYVLVLSAAGVALIYRHKIREFAGRVQPRQIILAVPAVVTPFLPYWQTTFTTPQACKNIYDEQYQMHRFAVSYYKKPVAVNDLGWVSFGNPNYVLDLWGLGRYEAYQDRLASNGNTSWISQLTEKYDVQFAMVYPGWITMPSSWHEVAILHLRDRSIIIGPAVAFFASPKSNMPQIRMALAEFRKTLPKDVDLLEP